MLWYSEDEGEQWAGPVTTPIFGAVPDRLIELKRGPHAGRWIVEAHTEDPSGWIVRCWYSDDRGGAWHGPRIIAAHEELILCEGSIIEMPGGELVCFLREQSKRGLDAFKCISVDGGETWEGPCPFPLPACHRPVAGLLRDDRVLITHRFAQHGKGWLGWWTQNTFAALTDVESCLARRPNEAHVRILPLDFDRSPVADCGYTGWVQFDDGEIYVVNYLVDDAPKAQIRGYSLRAEDFLIG
jgi:sialidase-1